MHERQRAPRHGGPILEVGELSVSYGRIRVVHEASFEVGEGTVTCLIGTNGAGKTTTLRGILGQQRPMTGTVSFAGEPIAGQPADRIARRGIGLVPEGRRVFASLSVFDNLRTGAAIRQTSWRSPDGVDEVFELFPELAEVKEREAGQLSGGQQQMLAIGRGLMARPRLLVLDEPSMGLAPTLVERIYAALGELKRQGASILLAEQNARLACELGDVMYVLETGRIVESGPADELRASPRVQEIYLGA